MRKLLASVGLLACAVLAAPASAQTSSAIVGKGPGAAGVAHTVTVTATITHIDKATREVTLKEARGHEITVQLSPEVKNFAQMKVGDSVTAEYVEALTLELKKGGKALVERTEHGGVATAKPGEKPGAMAGRQLRVTADVTAVDPPTQTVTLKGPHRIVDLRIEDPEQFKRVKVGDQVHARYTEALAIAVEPAKK